MTRLLPAAVLLTLCAANMLVQAQSKPGTMQKYLQAEGKQKAELRTTLLALPEDKLRAEILNARPAAPDAGAVIERETVCPDGFTRPYWVYVPEKYDAKNDYPLVVCLHGSCAQMPLRGRNGNVAPAMWALNLWKDNLPAEWKSKVALLGCSAGVPETTAEAAWYFKGGEANVMHMLAETKRFVSVDDSRVFISGHSDGGNGSFGFAFRRPEAFAGYLPMCANFTVPMLDDTPIWWENLKGANIYAFNGRADDLYPADELTPLYDIGNSLGARIEYKVHDKLTHDIRPVVAEEVKASLEQRITKWQRDLKVADIDWTCTDPARGHRAWLSIDAIADLGEKNAAQENAPLTGNGRPRLGVQLTESETPTVASTGAGSAAEAAGLKAGDVIIKFDETNVATVQDLAGAIGKKQPGDAFKITVKRDGKEVELKGSFPAPDADTTWRSQGKARVIASWKIGEVSLAVSNASKVSLYVFPQMLDRNGQLNVVLNGKRLELGKIYADNEFILDEFERTGERNLPWLRRVTIDVAAQLK
jgi:PDZ domain